MYIYIYIYIWGNYRIKDDHHVQLPVENQQQKK